MRRRYTTIGVAAALIASLISAPVASKPKQCSDQMTWVYDQNNARASFKLDLPRCWKGKAAYKVKAWIERHESTGEESRRVTNKRNCLPTKVCRISVQMEHPTTEAATYRASIQYMPTRNGAEISHRLVTCASHGSLNRCEQL